MSATLNPRPKDAAIPAIVNGVINGVITYSGHGGQAAVPLSVDSISSTEPTVWASAVTMSLALALILSHITAVVFRRATSKAHPEVAGLVNRPLFPAVTGIALQNALMLFGATVVVAVLWQRTFGTVMVSPATAAILVALFAAAVTVVVDMRTKRALLRER